MTHVERLRRLAESISIERTVAVGSTGYLDEHFHPESRMAKGRDKHGRVFITLCVRTIGRDNRHQYVSAGVVTVFQRYSDDENLVTWASNTPCAPHLFEGAATDADLDRLERLVMWGEASRTVEGVIGGTLHERQWIVAPEEAVAAGARRPRRDKLETS